MSVKKIAIVLFALILIFVTSVPALAVTNYEVKLKADKAQANKGETVKVTVSLANINVATGLGAFVGKLTYDETVFDTVEQADVVGATGWGTVLYNPDGGYLAVERASGEGVKEDNDVMVITLKVKENAAVKSGGVTISEISCSTGEEDLVAVDATVAITVTEQTGTEGGNNNTVNNNTVSNNAVSNNAVNNNTVKNNAVNNNVVNNNTIKNNAVGNTANSNLPHAGQVQNYIIPLIIIAIITAGISYIHYRKMKNI